MQKKEKIRQRDLAEELRRADISKEKRKQILENVRDKLEKDNSMKLSIKEGGFASIMSGLGDSYIIPFALALNSSNFQIGLLKSFSSLFPPLSQIFGSKLIEKYPRKKIIVFYVALQALMWIPILLLSFLFMKNIFFDYLPYFLILFYTFNVIFGAIAGPAWFSLLGDIVPENIRGRYFGKRNRITGTIALISTLIGAFLLDFFKTKGIILIGFSILFSIAGIARLISVYFFEKHYEPKFKLDGKYYFSFLSFLKGIKKYNFSRFSLFVAIMHFSVVIAGPFFSVYMLKELNFSYVTFMGVSLSASLFSLIMMPIWGKFSDKYGRKEVLIISSVLISIMPLLWFYSSSPYYLIFPMAISGIGWAGFNLSAFNFIYDSVSIRRRGLCVAYYNLLIGIGLFLGAGLGGIILKFLPLLNLNINSFLILFLVSGVLRGLSAIIFLPQIKEVRKVRKFHPVLLFKKMRITHGITHELMHDFGIEK
ncbi:MAG: MFS transporter [Nanoarchaeota archaeon]|nr:MFS transporter [Nanoarchaeota archaeon]